MSHDEIGNRRHSAVFTPMATAHEIAAAIPAEQIGPGKRCLDPACGSGNLLVAIAMRRLSLGVEPGDIAATTHGYDIQEEYVRQCRERLVKLLGDQHRSAIEANIVVQDFLAVVTSGTG